MRTEGVWSYMIEKIPPGSTFGYVISILHVLTALQDTHLPGICNWRIAFRFSRGEAADIDLMDYQSKETVDVHA